MARTRDINFDLGLEMDFLKDTVWKLSSRLQLVEDFISEKLKEVTVPSCCSRSNDQLPRMSAPQNSEGTSITETNFNELPAPKSRKRKRRKCDDTNSEAKDTIIIQKKQQKEHFQLSETYRTDSLGKSNMCLREKEKESSSRHKIEYKSKDKIQKIQANEDFQLTKNHSKDGFIKWSNQCAGEKEKEDKSFSRPEIENKRSLLLKLPKIQFKKSGEETIVVKSDAGNFDNEAKTIWTKTGSIGSYKMTGTNESSSWKTCMDNPESCSNSISTATPSNLAAISFSDDQISIKSKLITSSGENSQSSYQDEDESQSCEENELDNQLDYKRLKRQLIHRPETNIELPTNEYRCSMCNKKYRRKIILRLHWKKMHLEHNPLGCCMCKGRFETLRELKQHNIEVHKKPFGCEMCNKRFKNELLLLHHTKQHECDICGFKLKQKILLRYHRRSHFVKMLFECDQCGYATNIEASLTKHKASKHSNVFAFTCGECGTPYKSKSSAYVHFKRKHKALEYSLNSIIEVS